jgi:hypothetical protein
MLGSPLELFSTRIRARTRTHIQRPMRHEYQQAHRSKSYKPAARWAARSYKTNSGYAIALTSFSRVLADALHPPNVMFG